MFAADPISILGGSPISAVPPTFDAALSNYEWNWRYLESLEYGNGYWNY
jgi:hypothetical protein